LLWLRWRIAGRCDRDALQDAILARLQRGPARTAIPI
jgi:hypothetical protein